MFLRKLGYTIIYNGRNIENMKLKIYDEKLNKKMIKKRKRTNTYDIMNYKSFKDTEVNIQEDTITRMLNNVSIRHEPLIHESLKHDDISFMDWIINDNYLLITTCTCIC